MLRARVRPQWSADGATFRYSVRTGTGVEWFEVDCASARKRPVDPVTTAAPHELLSPDRTKVAFLRGFDLWVRDVASGVELQLTHDGTADRPYGKNPDVADFGRTLAAFGAAAPPVAVWSPDSTRLLTHQLDQTQLAHMHLVQSAPPDGGRPKLLSYRYAVVGEPAVATADLVVIDVRDGGRTTVDRHVHTPYLSPLLLKHGWWSEDGTRIWYADFGRAAASVELLAIDPRTGESRTAVQEGSLTQVQLGPLFTQVNVHPLDSGEIVWWSERTGWGHLYLYSADGHCRAITSGEWVVRDLVAVDEERRLVWFAAAGRETGSDPYVRQLYEISLDGGEPRRLTDDELDHHVVASPCQRYAVDVASRYDTPPVSSFWQLSARTATLLETADASALYTAGWVPPERFTVLAADGVTPLYGLLYRPQAVEGVLPVLDDIYPGPQVNAASVRFPASGGMTPAGHAAAMSALGFAVVVVDGRGTPLRHKAFQDATREGRDVVLDDHVAALRQLAATRPWLDLDRVGIYGASGGGQMSARAMLARPDFYDVAVSVAGDHDDAMYHAAWGERFFGHPDRFDYAAASNASLAGQLKGKLLLIHGDMDDNVTPHLTMRLINALMAADKDADLLLVPNADHAMLAHQAHWLRRRWDYVVRHLLGVEPPPYSIAPLPMDLSALEDLFG